jgi:tetratricopeptide (TPR) repeat protein
MNKQRPILIAILLGSECLLNGGQIVTYSQASPASAITLAAEDYLVRGRMGSSDEAIADLTKAIQLNPNYAEAYFERAETYFRWAKAYRTLHMKAKILEDYTRSIQLNPQYAVAYYQRGNVYALVGNQQAALADYSKVIQLNSQYADAYYQRGNIYVQIGDQQAALADYNQAIQLVPDVPEFYYGRGLLCDQLSDQRTATTDYFQVVRFAPSKAVERVDNQPAIAQFKQLISQSPSLANVYYRGLAHLYMGIAPNPYTKRNIGEDRDKDLNQVIQLNPKFADAYYYRGLSSSEGIQDFTKAIQLNSTFSAAYFERGLTQISRVSYNDEIDVRARQNAIKDFSQTIRLNPNYARAYYYRGRAYSGVDNSKAVMDYAQALRIDSRTHPYDPDVLRDYLRALETSPKQSMDYYRRGIVRRHFGDYSGAILDFNQVIRLDPKFAKTYYYRELVSSKDKDKKRQGFTQAIQLDPKFTEAYLERGLTYSSGVSLTGGFDDFSAAIRIKPNLAHAFYLRSAAHKKSCSSSTSCPSAEEKERARQKELEDLTQVVRLNPDFAQAFCSAKPWGDGGWRCNPVNEVPERYTQIIWLNPNQSIYLVSELVQDEQKQARRIAKRSTQAIQNNRQNADAYFRRGIAHLKLEQLDSAIADFTEAIKLNAQDAEAYSNRGFAYYRLKRYGEAITDYTQAIQLNSHFANAYFLRGLVHYDMGNHQQTVKDTTQAIRLDSTLSMAYIIRGRSRFALGDKHDAEADFKVGLESLPSLQQGAGDAAIAGGGKPNVYYDRGVSLARRGDKQAAIKTLQQAANLYRSQGNMSRYRETLAFVQRLK